MNKRKKTAWIYQADVPSGRYNYHIVRGGPVVICRVIMQFGVDPRLVEVFRKPEGRPGELYRVNPCEMERAMVAIHGSIGEAEAFIAYRALEGYEPSPRQRLHAYRIRQVQWSPGTAGA